MQFELIMSENDENSRPLLVRAYITVHKRPPTLDDHNFLVRTLICVFLDSTKSPLSLESGHMLVNDIWCSHIF